MQTQTLPLTHSQLRKFGFILATGLMIIFAVIPWLRHHEIYETPSMIAGLILVLGLIRPSFLKVIYHPWMKLGSILGWINTRIILSVIYFAIITPIGMILRLSGKDAMNRKYDSQAKSYRIQSKQAQPQDMERPF
jgi:heme/copper-type cytochrome/quinol oxidase subunit 4